MGFSTKISMLFAMSSSAIGTCVLFGVQIIAASGFGKEDERRALIDGK